MPLTQMSRGHVQDDHHALFGCSGYVYVREHFQDLFQSHIITVSQFSEPAPMQSCQVSHRDQDVALEPSLV